MSEQLVQQQYETGEIVMKKIKKNPSVQQMKTALSDSYEQREYKIENIIQTSETYQYEQKIQTKDKRNFKIYAQLCNIFLQYGHCKFGKSCKFRHIPIRKDKIPVENFNYNLNEIKLCNKIDEKELINLEYSIKPQQSKLNENDNLILIRHGISVYNYVGNKFSYETGKIFKDISALQYQLDPKLIDSPLHFYGVQQCINQQKIINKIKFHTIFVSPQLRALQTCYHLIKEHQDYKDKKIKIFVLPLLTEILSKVQDIASIGEEREKNFEEFEKLGFDFKYLVDESYGNKRDPNLWQLYDIKNLKLREKIKNQMIQNNKNYNETCLALIKENFPKSVETYEMVYERKLEAKQFIKNYIKKNKLHNKKEQKICIISHHGFLKTWTSSGISQSGYVIHGNSFGNCQLVSDKL
ncbi:hypothetical protein PPERSA_10758 [Pseudocohnilembus persalinus]|uniref:C3H1-type domain-containing protein n=1 Tax=Pseudocohnilembus persalinus TaxID=266149 RepID=A0A0V0QDH5_PSEPJ|nr:hypothetical protein PPERSA_10758 [Pseudocohnilembus persalinus]|eukprot:KRX00259.1 hypothetical protein PPERSA_10758 [Pseudocohnilembus persalinus]